MTQRTKRQSELLEEKRAAFRSKCPACMKIRATCPVCAGVY